MAGAPDAALSILGECMTGTTRAFSRDKTFLAMRWLVGYYGVFQAGHLVFNVVHLSGLRSISEDFPPPPAEGWHPQTVAFWTACALIDTAIALLALYFVAAFFGGRRGALWAGFVSLTMYMCTIFIFDYTVVATGAWARHPVEYVVLNVVTIPLLILFAVFVRDVRRAADASEALRRAIRGEAGHTPGRPSCRSPGWSSR